MRRCGRHRKASCGARRGPWGFPSPRCVGSRLPHLPTDLLHVTEGLRFVTRASKCCFTANQTQLHDTTCALPTAPNDDRSTPISQPRLATVLNSNSTTSRNRSLLFLHPIPSHPHPIAPRPASSPPLLGQPKIYVLPSSTYRTSSPHQEPIVSLIAYLGSIYSARYHLLDRNTSPPHRASSRAARVCNGCYSGNAGKKKISAQSVYALSSQPTQLPHTSPIIFSLAIAHPPQAPPAAGQNGRIIHWLSTYRVCASSRNRRNVLGRARLCEAHPCSTPCQHSTYLRVAIRVSRPAHASPAGLGILRRARTVRIPSPPPKPRRFMCAQVTRMCICRWVGCVGWVFLER